MKRTPDIVSSTIVAVGAFNPAIFTPDWLEKHNLIGPADADVARSSPSIIVSQQVSTFETDTFSIQVLENQFTLNSKGVLTPAIKDLAAGVLTLLPHTPIKALSLNFLAHYRMQSESAYHEVGDVLAPKDIWSSLYPEERSSAGLGLLTIVIQSVKRGEALQSGNHKQISVRASGSIKPYGIFFTYNDHHQIDMIKDDGRSSAEHAAAIVDSNWDDAYADALRVFDGVLSQALADKR